MAQSWGPRFFWACLCCWPLACSGGSIKNHGTHPQTEQEVVAHEYESLYLVFGALVVGTAVIHVTSSVPALHALPVTVVFFVLGIVLALVAESGALNSYGIVLRSYEAWAVIDPHLLLFTFLPPLLFGDAMTIDTHVARRTGAQCLILAGPGVVIGSLATAAVLCFVLPYGWDFSTSLMVGSILAATDPVAVVSLLKDLGASPVLTMQIQGESLLNDGTAMVLFTIAYGMVEGKECDAKCMLTFLLKSTLGASIMGICIGMVFYWWIRAANNSLNHSSSIIQISLTLACAYWSFIFAEGIYHISGVLSTVMAAVTLAKKMWPVLVEHKAMLEFWHVIETVGNTLVFCLAGMLTGRAIPMHSKALEDCFWAVVVYLAVTVIRFLMLLLLRPLLNRCGSKVSMKDVLIMTWGGLRGMVGLALAILVDRDRAGGMLSGEDGERVLFLVGGVAALTLVINATTAPKLCTLLGVNSTPEGRMVLVSKVARSAEAHVNSELEKLLKDNSASRSCMLTSVCESVQQLHEKIRCHFPVDGSGDGSDTHFPSPPAEKKAWTPSENNPPESVLGQHSQPSLMRSLSSMSLYEKTVTQIRGSRAHVPDVDDLWKRFSEQKQLVRAAGPSNVVSFQFRDHLPEIRKVLSTTAIDPGQLQIVREVFLEIVRASYWDQLQKGRFLSGSKEPSILLNSVSLAKEQCCQGLADWQILERDLVISDISEIEQGQQDRYNASTRRNADLCDVRQSAIADLRTWGVVQRCLERQDVRRHLRHQQRAIQICTAFIQAHRLAQTQIASYFGSKAHRVTDSAEVACVVLESQLEVFSAAATLNRIDKPVRKRMNTTWEVHRLCDQYRRFVLKAHESGVLQSKEVEALMHPVAEVLQELARDRKKISDELASACAGSGIAHLLKVAAALEIQREWREYQTRQRFRLTVEATRQGGESPSRLLLGREASAGQLKHACADAAEEVVEPHRSAAMMLEQGSNVRHVGSNGSGASGSCNDVIIDLDADIDAKRAGGSVTNQALEALTPEEVARAGQPSRWRHHGSTWGPGSPCGGNFCMTGARSPAREQTTTAIEASL